MRLKSPSAGRPRLRLERLERRDTPTAIVPPPGLLSWWPGDGNAADIVGSNDGTLQNGAAYRQGQVADGFDFDGGDDLFEAPTDSLPTGNADRTMSLWVRIDSQSTQEAFFASYGSPGLTSQVYTVGRRSNHRLFASTWTPDLEGPIMDDGVWHHVAVSNVGSEFGLYLNGVLVASGPMAVNTPAGSTFWVGRQTPGSIGDLRRLDGTVDEVTVFNRALTSVEISSIYQAGRDGMLKPYMVVNGSTPGEAAPVTTPPTQFVVDFSHAVAPATVQADDLRVNGIPATSFSFVDGNTVAFQFSSSPVTFVGVQSMAMAAGAVLADGSVAEPSLRAWTESFSFDAPIVVQSVQVNDGAVQRSRLSNLTITFNAQITFAGTTAQAFSITRNGGGPVAFTAQSQVVGGVTVVTLSNFSGAETQFSSLRDGRYTLIARASQISANGNQMAGDFTFGDAQKFYRFYGDMNGDRRVDISDFGFFSLAYLSPANYNLALDFNNDGRIDIADFGQFSVRFFTTLP